MQVRLFLTVEKPERLEAEGAEFEILHGSVLTEKGLEAWAPRVLGVDAGLPFLEIATKAREKGHAIFALPGKTTVDASAGVVTEEVPTGDRKLLVRHGADWAGSCLVRFELDGGGVSELEAPGWLMQDFIATRAELKNVRDALRVAKAELETTGKFLDAMTRECADLKAGRGPTPSPGTKGRGRKKGDHPAPTTGNTPPSDESVATGPRPVAPATAPTTPASAPTVTAGLSVADVRAELATTMGDAPKAPADSKPRKYRGSGGD